MLSLLLAGAALGQQTRQPTDEYAAVAANIPLEKLPEFEVADIQPSKSNEGPRAQFLPGGKIQFEGLPLKFMVLAAWGYENDQSRVTGGESWVNSDKYDIVAKARPDTPIVTLRLMLRQLLMKRFGLEIHVQEESKAVYALEKGKGSPKVTPSASKASPECHRSMEDRVIMMNCRNMTMDEFATAVRGMAPAYIDRPVINLTGLEGQYDFKLGWTPRGQLLGATGEGRGGAADGGSRPDGSVLSTSDPTAGGLTVFEGIEKHMGLKLNGAKHDVPIIVIDKINRTPVEN